ncbi:MAG: condensation domain-containing protein, partial [Coleofasciculus sp. G1-WW12-02]|uniref:condensation domain-containing protein n=1 Tax=Coleofasciculus sp. G1-WW12-02 TaxID=3068483 RepID=UPI0032FE68B8
MKTVEELLSYFHTLDVKLWVQDDKLRYSAPKETLTPNLLAQLKERKAEIVEFLQKTAFGFSSSVEPIQPVPRTTDLPLSFAQQKMWLINQLEGNNPTYNESVVVKISGSLQVAVLERSFREIIQRHEALRTTFKTVNGQPVQVILPTFAFTLPVIDLRSACSSTPARSLSLVAGESFSKTQQEAEVQRLLAEEIQQPFDLTKSPLMRVRLLQLGQTEHVLQIVMHHIVSDNQSVGLIFQELKALYEAFASAKPSPLPDLPIQYADFAVWQRQYLQGDLLSKELTYWKQQLAKAPTVLQLPTARSRSPVPTFAGKTQFFVLPKTLIEALKATSRATGATLFMTLLAVFKTLLYRYTGQEDILVISPMTYRNRVELENLIGNFMNILALRTDLSGNPSFRELLGRVREVTLGAYEHQNLPVEMLLPQLQLEHNSSQTNLFPVGFVFNSSMPNSELSDLTLSWLKVDSPTAKLDLTLYLEETQQGLSASIEYKTDLFDAATIARMVGHFQTLLEGIVANPNQRLSDLPLLTSTEQHQLWVEWNNTQADYPKHACIHQLFEAQVERTPDAVAVVFEDEQL